MNSAERPLVSPEAAAAADFQERSQKYVTVRDQGQRARAANETTSDCVSCMIPETRFWQIHPRTALVHSREAPGYLQGESEHKSQNSLK